MIAALFPEAGAILGHKFQAVEPLGAFIGVEFGNQQAHRAAVIGFEVLAIVFEDNHYIVII